MTTPYTLIRSNRHTLSLVIGPDGGLTARAPKRMPLHDIEAFILQKQRWILEKQAQAQTRASQKPAFALEEGALLPFWGDGLTLRFALVPMAFAFHGTLLLPQSTSAASASLKAWLLAQAQAALPPLVQAQAGLMGLNPSRVGFSTARSRWGSMNSKGTLRLNIALLLCPPPVVDYVIVHELAHIRHPNHSTAFWKLVERWMPDYQQKRAWLRAHSTLTGLLQAR